MQDYKHIQKRRIISALLLTLYVVCQTITITHWHEYAEHTHIVCVDCQNHVQHHGHIGALEKVHDDCVLCQTLTMPVLFVPFFVFFFRHYRQSLLLPQVESRLAVSYATSQPLRGPPSFL